MESENGWITFIVIAVIAASMCGFIFFYVNRKFEEYAEKTERDQFDEGW